MLRSLSRLNALAGVVKSADTQDLGSCAPRACGFKSHLPHGTPTLRRPPRAELTADRLDRRDPPLAATSPSSPGSIQPPSSAGPGPWALLVVCFIVFAETGLLIGFLLPGDTLLVISRSFLTPTEQFPNGVFGVSVWIVALSIAFAAFLGGEVGYLIGYKGGPAVFERKESGLFSVKNVERTNAFFHPSRYGQ